MALTTSSVAGIIAGRNPLEYSTSDPITVYLFQAIFIILLCQIVHIPLSYIRQPKVIAEVITGILLGPSVLGKIPHFTNTVFSTASIPGLTLVANLGLILFLFIVGLEVDLKFIKRNLKVALSVGLISMAVPFGLGSIISIGLYDRYRDKTATAYGESLEPIKFSTYLVFISVAMCITAFPVLARILTELNLLKDNVGTIVLAAGITNDLMGWILLALSITLANSGSGVNTVYILLVISGFFLFLTYPVKFLLRWYLVKSNDLVNGPSQFAIMIILVMVFTGAFFTDILGVHPIFGAFLMGIIIPRDNNYVVKLTEKIEDLVNVAFIPLYFALAGLKCDLSLLNEGIDWAYIVAILATAMFGKIISGMLAAKLNRLFWRESLAVGVLMSCKGIVEIVVLTVGLNAGIISEKTFAMFIVMALASTFLTTPLTLLVYPVSYREKVARYRNGEINWDGSKKINENQDSSSNNDLNQLINVDSFENFRLTRVVPIILNLDSITDVIDLLHYLIPSASSKTNNKEISVLPDYSLHVHATHLRRLTQRTADIIQASSKYNDDELTRIKHDPLLLTIKMISELNGGLFTSSSKIFSANESIFSSISDISNDYNDLFLFSIKSSSWRNLSSFVMEDFNSLIRNTKCQLSFLLENKNSFKLRHQEVHADDNTSESELQRANSVDLSVENSSITTKDISSIYSGYKAVNLILNGSNIKNDLLSLHIFLKLSSQSDSIDFFKVFVNESTITHLSEFYSLIKLYQSQSVSLIQWFYVGSNADKSVYQVILEDYFYDEEKIVNSSINSNLFITGISGVPESKVENDHGEEANEHNEYLNNTDVAAEVTRFNYVGDGIDYLISEGSHEGFNVLICSSPSNL